LLDECRRFVEESDESPNLDHPYYWAGFAAFGAPGLVIEPVAVAAQAAMT
jgi:hypothetical protein